MNCHRLIRAIFTRIMKPDLLVHYFPRPIPYLIRAYCHSLIPDEKERRWQWACVTDHQSAAWEKVLFYVMKIIFSRG